MIRAPRKTIPTSAAEVLDQRTSVVNNTPMRRAVAVHTLLAVVLWFFTGPFLHLHASEADQFHHHQQVGADQDAIVHFHLPAAHRPSGGTSLSGADESERPLDSVAIVGTYAPGLSAPFVITARVEAPKIANNLKDYAVAAQAPRAHDPPGLRVTHPRDPPY